MAPPMLDRQNRSLSAHDDGDQVTFGRRQAVAALGAGMLGFGALGSAYAQQQPTSPLRQTAGQLSSEEFGWDPKAGRYVLPALPYGYDALEPSIDAQTMKLHHDKHHAGYVAGLNKALQMLEEIRAGSRDKSEVTHWSRELAFHGSGHFLHTVFWHGMSPKGGGKPSQSGAAGQINRNFGSFDGFSNHFQAAAAGVEGSGWGILAFEPISGNLTIMQAEKHQNLTAWGVIPLLCVDVWEHAYYLKYQNDRKQYVANFMNVINWAFVEYRLTKLLAIRNERSGGGG